MTKNILLEFYRDRIEVKDTILSLEEYCEARQVNGPGLRPLV